MSDKYLAVLFQALRIQVNQELEKLESFLEIFPKYLLPGGRCLIMTYHSIEDRIVKKKFQAYDRQGTMKLINKHVIVPSREEVRRNKASRSAKLRVIEKLKVGI